MSPGLRAARVRLGELARAVAGDVIGDPDTPITGVSSLDDAGAGDVAWVEHARARDAARQSKASALVVPSRLALDHPQLVVPNPRLAVVLILEQFFLEPDAPRGVAPEVHRGRDVRIGPGASIWPFVTIGDRTVIGARVTLYSGVFLGDDVVVGDDCVLYPNVTVRERCRLGSRVIVHAGAVIGSDGFGYVLHEGRHRKIPQLGHVVIADDVELGANVTVDRATFGRTVVGRGTKVDNLVQIAHNVVIGEHTVMAGQVGVAGSTRIGSHVAVGGQSGFADHIEVGDRVQVAARSGVAQSVAAGEVMSGNPATPHAMTRRVLGTLYLRLPEMARKFGDMERRLAELEARAAAPKPPPRRRKR
jgi:UDP-3-O-[3-hydroxymyristoyl] glucosamine N-acyltransferase